MKKKLKKLKNVRIGRTKAPKIDPGLRVTNDTVAVHREVILKGARKYIYPLQHSKRRLVVISISLVVIALLGFMSYMAFSLYKTKASSGFLYKVTKVVPFPIARIGSDFVPYENYLFEINHYTHYYHTQQQLDFNSDAGKQQLTEFKKRALEKVINDAYIKEIAKQKNIVVSETDIDDAIAVVRNQNRLSGSDQELEAILKDYWNWSVGDFRRSLKSQLLAQKVLSSLDTDSHSRAEVALAQLKNGKDFAELAKEVSEDPITKAGGGEFAVPIDKTNRDISPKTVEALFALKPGEYSGIVDTGTGLEIVKNLEVKGEQIRAAHIYFGFKELSTYLNNYKDQKKTRSYISV